MAIVIDPSLADAHSNLGNMLKVKGKLTEAKKAYLEAIRLRPDFAIAWSNLGGIFKEENDFKTSIAYYKEALRHMPSTQKPRSRRADHTTLHAKIVHSNLAQVTLVGLFRFAHAGTPCGKRYWHFSWSITLHPACPGVGPLLFKAAQAKPPERESRSRKR